MSARVSRGRDPAQPAVHRCIVSPCHRHQTERGVDREALPDGVLTIAAVAHGIDDGQMVVADARHRTTGRQAFVQLDEGGATLVERWELCSKIKSPGPDALTLDELNTAIKNAQNEIAPALA